MESQVGAIRPAVVQNKLDVYHVGKQLDSNGDSLVTYAREQGVVVVAYSSFSAYPFVMKPIDDPIIKAIAADHPPFATSDNGDAVSVTPAMVLLRWSMQKGTAVIPRSSDRTRLLENYNALNRMLPLSVDEMGMIDSLQRLVSSPISKAIVW
jgi:diketogulonate reductase-like aldo/keto reductase